MTWPYIHTLINHFPIILTVVACGALVLALIMNKRALWLYALATFTLAGVTIYPANFTGDQASHALKGVWYIDRDTVHEHDDAASYAVICLLITGALTGVTWWWMVKRAPTETPPIWLRAVIAVVAAFAMAIVTRTAYLGGKIVVDSPKLANPPGGAPVTPPGGG